MILSVRKPVILQHHVKHTKGLEIFREAIFALFDLILPRKTRNSSNTIPETFSNKLNIWIFIIFFGSNPNGEGLFPWNAHTEDNQCYLALSTKPEERRDYKPDKMELWHTRVYDMLMSDRMQEG